MSKGSKQRRPAEGVDFGSNWEDVFKKLSTPVYSGPGKILKNSAQCAVCLDIIVSKYRHDYQSCECGEIFVDGGKDYLRAGARNMDNFIDLVEVEV